MAISVKQGFTIPIQSSFPLEVRPAVSRCADDLGPIKSSFASALTGALKKGENVNDRQGLNDPLSGEKIAALIRQMRQQANDHLFRILTEDDRKENWGSSFPEVPSPAVHSPAAPAAPVSEAEASKIQRSLQKNDGPAPPADLEQIIAEAADAYGVEGSLIRSVIKVESNFASRSTSSRGAMGLMQLMPGTARELGVRDAYNPRENVMAGTKYLKGLLDRYGGDTRLALAAYNWGMGNVEKYPGKLPQETKDYLARVARYHQDAKA